MAIDIIKNDDHYGINGRLTTEAKEELLDGVVVDLPEEELELDVKSELEAE